MKKITFLAVSLLAFIFSHAQVGELWGMTQQGGDSGKGVIFKYNVTSKQDSVVFNFKTTTSYSPSGSLIMASDGNLYGMTSGGSFDNGSIFKCTPSGKYTTLVTFTTATGAQPLGSLIQASDGNLYGMTKWGGTFGYGTLFKCTLAGSLTTLINFDGSTNGEYPYGSLIQANDGNLYGNTQSVGGAGTGTLFKCTISGTLTTLVNFSNNEPSASLVQGIDGYLYGMTSGGGSSTAYGTIFKCSTSGVLTTLVTFTGANGAYPYGNLIQGSDSNLYGTTYEGGTLDYGTIFKCTTSGTLTTLVSFAGTNGCYTECSLIQATDGNLYGMASSGGPQWTGGTSGYGTVFKCTTSGTFTTLVNFNDTVNGAYPYLGSLLEIHKPVGINNIKANTDKISVYPNPASDKLNITIDAQGSATITILDITGKEVISESISKGNNTISIDVSSLSHGLYIVKVTTDKKVMTVKFEKQ